jgi:hypothetical protein
MRPFLYDKAILPQETAIVMPRLGANSISGHAADMCKSTDKGKRV